MQTRPIQSLLNFITGPGSSARPLFTRLLVIALCGTFTGSIAQANNLVLWNRLGSSTEILNSAYGPNLEFYAGGDAFSVPATPNYVPGMFGNALTIGPGSYGSADRVHNVTFNNVSSYLNAEHGTVEAWFKQLATPIPYQNGIYRIFDGGFGLNSGIGLESNDGGLMFSVYFGGTYTYTQYDISSMNGNWIHVAGVWDRAGIDGSADKVRLYVNGAVVAASSSGDWGTTVGSRADIGGANDYDIVDKFYEDNLKVYDFAMTDFSHRFDENWVVPEPGTGSLIALGGLLMLWRRCREGLKARPLIARAEGPGKPPQHISPAL